MSDVNKDWAKMSKIGKFHFQYNGNQFQCEVKSHWIQKWKKGKGEYQNDVWSNSRPIQCDQYMFVTIGCIQSFQWIDPFIHSSFLLFNQWILMSQIVQLGWRSYNETVNQWIAKQVYNINISKFDWNEPLQMKVTDINNVKLETKVINHQNCGHE